MKDLFPNYYSFDEQDWNKLWNNCLFILDTNVLLNLYRYNKATSDDLLRVLKSISSRLWIPHQVALEYQENRQDVVIGQINKYTDVENVLNEVRRFLQEKLAGLDLEERHYSIDPNRLQSRFEAVLADFSKELETLKNLQPQLLNELSNEIDELFLNKIGPSPSSQGELNKIYDEAKVRFQQKRPPGFMDKTKEKKDQSKKTAYFYNDLYFQRQYGDVLVWFQILEKAKTDKINCIIFVTDEHKEDWWRKSGGRQIGPCLELIDEIRTKANVDLFHMYNSARFMTYAKKYLGIEIKQESIDQVRQLTRTANTPDELRRQSELAFRAVYQWLKTSYPNDDIVLNEFAFPDIIRINHETSEKIGYEIKLTQRVRHIRMIIRDLMYRGYYEVNERKLNKFVIVLVLDTTSGEAWPEGDFRVATSEIPTGVSIIIGSLLRASETENEDQIQFVRHPVQMTLF